MQTKRHIFLLHGLKEELYGQNLGQPRNLHGSSYIILSPPQAKFK